jgi:RES domain-containing protein
MRLWRISNRPDLSGEGGMLASGRWHSRGIRVVYLADHPASALLEALVHLEVDREDIPVSYQLLAVEFPENVSAATIEPESLAAGWTKDTEPTRTLGNVWLVSRKSALLRVPSAIVPSGWNWLLNPAHPDSARAQIAEIIRAPFDPRLFKTG